MKRVSESSFLLAVNGNRDSPPASGVRDFLAERARELTTIYHPLGRGDPALHILERWEGGVQVVERRLRRPSRPPYSFPLDAVSPLRRPRVDAWIGFSNLSASYGILRRRAGRAGKVAYWAVDFVPDRFGPASALTRAYDAVDRFASLRVDLRIELSAAARDGRAERHGLGPEAAPTHIAPVGAWLERVARTPEDGWSARRVVFIGHIDRRQGVETLIEAVALLPDVTLDIAGRGDEEERLRALVERRGLSGRVHFLGFLSDHEEVERLAATGSVGAAPYATGEEFFTRFADPSKLRLYAAGGLPVVTTPASPAGEELARVGGASVVPCEAAAIAAAIAAILSSPAGWQQRRAQALAYAQGSDWSRIVPAALAALGFAA